MGLAWLFSSQLGYTLLYYLYHPCSNAYFPLALFPRLNIMASFQFSTFVIASTTKSRKKGRRGSL